MTWARVVVADGADGAVGVDIGDGPDVTVLNPVVSGLEAAVVVAGDDAFAGVDVGVVGQNRAWLAGRTLRLGAPVEFRDGPAFRGDHHEVRPLSVSQRQAAWTASSISSLVPVLTRS